MVKTMEDEGPQKRAHQSDGDGSASSSNPEGGDGDDGISNYRRQQLAQLTIGTKLEIYWQDDNVHYPGTVAAHFPNEWQQHIYTIDYDDGESESVDMATERFRILGGTLASASAGAGGGDNNNDGGDGSSKEVQSLTVRFNQRNETWRSPPTYVGGEDFVWPTGWIEIQRLSEVEGDEDGGSKKRPSSPSPNKRQWIREFHPPHPARKVCHSIEEVKKYIQQQKAKHLKQERMAAAKVAADSSKRASGRQRKSSMNNSDMSLSSHHAIHRIEGTQSELNKIMKQKNKLSSKMKQAIIYSAVLARKKNTHLTESGFLGANGRMYPDLRKAFGQHVDMKQCSLCKQRVQGHWYCRITHSHLDKPDYDGGNSAGSLAELFRCGVNELEERLWNLQSTGRKKRSADESLLSQGRKMGPVGFEGTDGWSMNVMSEDLLFHIASFLPSLSQLTSFCRASKRGQDLLYRSVHSEKLFRGVYLRSFGKQGMGKIFEGENNLSWKERWVLLRDLRRGLVKKTLRPPSAISQPLRDSVGVLHPLEERDALYYDNPEYVLDPDRATCNGYFGMEILNLPRPPNANESWEPPVALLGDFNGIRIFSSLQELFYQSNNTVNGGNVSDVWMRNNQNRFLSLGDDEGGGQVLSFIHCDLNHAAIQSQSDGSKPPCCFIGYMSGRVAAVSATLSAEKDKYEFTISGTHHAHDSEVTALSFVNCSSTRGCDEPVLFSACCGGKVYLYPNACDPAKNFSLEQSVVAFSNYYDCPIFSMTSTVIHSQDKSFSVIVTGDRDGNIRVWLKRDQDDLIDLCTRTEQQKFSHIQLRQSSTQRGTGYHLVTKAMFIENNLLITGTNEGDVRFWQLQCVEDKARAIGKGPQPSLSLRYDLMGIHSGAVELLLTVGDILLSSGGNDGKIVGWDVSNGLKMGSIECHRGRQLEERSNVRSCVVDMLISGGCLISLCRDGSLRQFQL